MAVKVAVVNSLGISKAWRVQNAIVKQKIISGVVLCDFDLLPPDESQFHVLQSDVGTLKASISANIFGVFMQDGTRLSLQASTWSNKGWSEAVSQDESSTTSGIVGLYVGIAIVGVSASGYIVFRVVKKMFLASTANNSYVV